MAGLNIVVAFFAATVALSQLIRWLGRKVLPTRIYRCTLSELAASLQLCACFMELRMLMEIGMWGGGFGPDVVSTLLFLLFIVHGFTFDGASANSAVSLQGFLQKDCTLTDTVFKLVSQYVGMEAAKFLIKQYWMLELTEFHTIQVMMLEDCSTSLQTTVPQGVFVEALCAFCYHLVLLRFQKSRLFYKVPIIALTVTLLVYAGGPYTAAYFNPILAYNLTFDCSGKTLREYVMVYFGGSLVGMMLALFLYEGNIPKIFKRNLLYAQKSKFRTPKAKTVQVKASNNVPSSPKQKEKKSETKQQPSKVNVTSKEKHS